VRHEIYVLMCLAVTHQPQRWFHVFVALCPSHITSSGWGCGFQINCGIYEPCPSCSRL